MALKPLRGALGDWAPGKGIVADPLYALEAAWPAIVGPDVAANSAPLAINGKTLLVATRSSAWSQQLQFLSTTILLAMRDLPQARGIERLSFRAGALRRVPGRSAARPVRAARTGRKAPAQEPAADLGEALARLRRRLSTLRRTASATCASCGAPLGSDDGSRVACAPCMGEAERRREAQLQRLLYMAPWITRAELAETLPGVSVAEFERARRYLLQRWWLVLERTRRAGSLSGSGVERQVASSYVLLQSRLPPDRITPAVVLNLLGAELQALLWPAEPAPPEPRP
jgi:hypothetical protein